MGEQPIFTTKAHVFQIDPNTKKKWLPTSSQAVNVSYYYDSSRNTYRIISVEGSKAIINSTITPNMTFTKTSQKFGQWSDSRANTVYGLGFMSEQELLQFVEKFKEVKELSRQPSVTKLLPQSNGTGDNNHAGGDAILSNGPVVAPPAVATKPPQVDHVLAERATSSPGPGHPGTSLGPGHVGTPNSSLIEQLKYENDRLKIALAQSSANAKKWEVELQTLKNNNARLTTALQESTANVEEWKKQLATYKEESARMKLKVLELDTNGTAGGSTSTELLRRQLGSANEKVHDLEVAAEKRQQEVDRMMAEVERLLPFESDNRNLLDRTQSLDGLNDDLRKQIKSAQKEAETARDTQRREKDQLRLLQQQLSSRISDVYGLSDKFADLLKTEQ